MAKYLIDFWVDGYDDESERTQAGKEIIEEYLNHSWSGIKVLKIIGED